MAVISKQEVKVAKVVAMLPDGFSVEQFVVAFQETYPKDWDKIVRTYIQNERKTKRGYAHLMPPPVQFLKNALSSFRLDQHRRPAKALAVSTA